jgi:hypothetical protein
MKVIVPAAPQVSAPAREVRATHAQVTASNNATETTERVDTRIPLRAPVAWRANQC